MNLTEVQDLAQRLGRFQLELNAITTQGDYEISEMADEEDVAQIVSHT